MQTTPIYMARVFPERVHCRVVVAICAASFVALSCSETTNPSSNGRLHDRIIFESDRLDARGDIFTMALDGTDVRRITNETTSESCPSLSPNADVIAVTSPEGTTLSLMQVDGSDRHVIVSATEISGTCPVWSPKGNLIAYRRASNIEIITPQGAKVSTVSPTGTYSYFESVAFSPDGNRVLLSEQLERGIVVFWIAAPENGQTRAPVSGRSPSWTPNGDSILYTCSDTVPTYLGKEHLCIKSADGPDKRVVVPGDGAAPMISPNGMRVAYVCAYGLMCVINRAGNELARFPVHGYQYAWAPDGKSFVLQCPISEPGRTNFEICSHASDGSGLRNLTNNPGSDAFPSFAPFSH